MIEHRGGITVEVQPHRDDDVRWLALTIRRAFLLVCRAIEARYGLDESKGRG